MRVAILSSRAGWHTNDLCRALERHGHSSVVVPYESLVARLGPATMNRRGLSGCETPLFDIDAVLVRNIPVGSLEQIIFRVDALHWLEEHGVRVMNAPRALERCVDKFYTTARLQEAGLLVPETIVCERASDAMIAVRELGEVVVKPIFGSLGHGMVRVSDPDTAFRVCSTLEQLRAVFYVQRAIPHHGWDLRLLVVGGQVAGAIERRAALGEWRTNVSRGGTPSRVDIGPELAQMAVKAAEVLGAEYAGVDLLPARDGSTYVLEVNSIPGWQGLQRATGIDIASAVVEQLTVGVCVGSAQ